MDEFIYSQPVKIYFGEGKFSELNKILEQTLCTSAVIACGHHFSSEAKKLMEQVPQIKAVYDEVEPNPQLIGAETVAKLCKKHDADTVIGIGGGSSMDTAKFAAAIARGDADAIEYYHGEMDFPSDRLKIIAVPTTAGTGSEVTQVSVMSNGSEKRTINNSVFMPTAAVVDPLLSSTVPPKTTMVTGLDALAHALEGYWSVNHQPISSLIAIEAVRIILENLETAYTDGSNISARSNMAYASLLGGLSFALPKTAACHACSYPLSEDYHLSHGEACAFTLDSFVRINNDDRLEYLSQRSGIGSSEALADKIHYLKKLAGLKMTLDDLEDVNLEKLCHDCSVHGLMNNNPVRMTDEMLKEMFLSLKA